MRRRVAGICAGSLLGGLAVATVVAPTAAAAPDQCSAGGLAGTVSSVTGQAHDFLSAHPGANQVLTAAASQPRGQAEADIRGYFTANPQEYFELRGILAPIGDVQRQCGVSVIPPELSSAYAQFMAG